MVVTDVNGSWMSNEPSAAAEGTLVRAESNTGARVLAGIPRAPDRNGHLRWEELRDVPDRRFVRENSVG